MTSGKLKQMEELMIAPSKGLSNVTSCDKIEVATNAKFLEGALIINDNRLPCLGR